MAAIDFPASPSTNQTHTASGITWTWDGTSWKAQGSTTTYNLPTASTGTLGGIKVGNNFAIDGSGSLSLSAVAISGLTNVTAASADYLMLWDATDSSLKKVDAGELLGGGGGGLSSIGIQSGGTQIGAGITQLNFIGTGNTFAVSGNTVDVSIGVDSVDAIIPFAFAVVGTNSAGTGTGMSWGAYNSSNQQVVFTFDTAQPNTNYYVHTNREHYATHNIEVIAKTTTGFTTKWTNSDSSALPPGTFKGVLIVYGSNPLTSVGSLNTNDGVIVKNSGSLIGTAGTINFGDNLSVTALSAGIVTVTSSTGVGVTEHIRAQTLTVAGVSTFTGNIDANGMLDVDGPTHLDYVDISGVTTFAQGYRVPDDIYGIYGASNDFGIGHKSTGGWNQGAENLIDSGSMPLRIRTGSAKEIRFATTDTERVIITAAGLVGIGSTVPVNMLDVNGTISASHLNVAGVVTAASYQGSGSALTNLNATKITSGTVPTARLGSGTANNSVFLRGDNTWATPSGGGSGISNVIDDTTPELGGHLNLNSKNLTGAGTFTGTPVFDCNVKVKNNRYLNIGDSNALQLSSGGSNVTYTHAAGGLVLFESNFGIDIGGSSSNKAFAWRASTNEAGIYYNNSLKLNTATSGVNIVGTTTTGQLAVTGVSTFTGAIVANGAIDLNADLDVDGHTNLDNVNIAGVTTFSGALDINAGVNISGLGDFAASTFNNVRAGYSGDGEIDTSSGNLILDSAGGTVQVTDNLSVTGSLTGTTATFSGNVSIAGTLTYEDVKNVDSIGIITARNGINVQDDATFTGATTNMVWDKSDSKLKFNNILNIYNKDGSSRIEGASGGMFFKATGAYVWSNNSLGTRFEALDSSCILYANGGKVARSRPGELQVGNPDGSIGVGATLGITGNAFFGGTGIVTATSFDGELAYHTAWTLGASGSSHYTFTGNGLTGAENDPTIYLVRGQKYAFKNRSGGHPFRIQHDFQATSSTAYNDGITNNSAGNGTDLIWNVQFDAPDVLYYQCTAHTNMSGKIIILGKRVTQGSWTASAGSANTIDTIAGISSNKFKTAEYTVHIEHATGMQSQKVLAMNNGTTAYSQEFAIMHDGGLLVSVGTTITGGGFALQATPETGVTGITTYRVTRETMT